MGGLHPFLFIKAIKKIVEQRDIRVLRVMGNGILQGKNVVELFDRESIKASSGRLVFELSTGVADLTNEPL